MADGAKVHSSTDETIGGLLARNASQYGSDIALREKERGIWKETTWAEYADEITACAAGLEALGVGPGKAVLILGDNRARLYAGILATSLLRAYPMPAYPGATLGELQHFLGEVEIDTDHCGQLVQTSADNGGVLDVRAELQAVLDVVGDVAFATARIHDFGDTPQNHKLAVFFQIAGVAAMQPPVLQGLRGRFRVSR